MEREREGGDKEGGSRAERVRVEREKRGVRRLLGRSLILDFLFLLFTHHLFFFSLFYVFCFLFPSCSLSSSSSFLQSISGSIRRFTTTMNDNQQPKSIASAPKSNSFSVESKSLNDISEREIKKEGGREERRSEGEERLVVKKRARGKKIRTDPTRKWSLTVAETPGGEPETAKGEGEGQGQDMEPEETPGNDMEVEKEDTGMEIETPGGPEGQKVESRANTPNNTDWVAFEKPLPQIEAGSSVWLVGGAREGKTKGDEKNKYSDVAKKEGERRKSSGGLFTCFGGGGGTKKKP